MLVAVAVAALSYLGAKGNYRNALKIANNMPTGGLPAFAPAGAGGGTAAGTGVVIGPSAGGPAVVGAAAVGLSDKEKAALGEGPDVDGLREKEVGEARSSERRDRRAADGRAKPEPDNAAVELHEKPRTELAEHIPPPGDAFIDWFDSLTVEELDRLLADKSVKGKTGAAQVIADNVRHPGSQHEWLMVAEARKFKRWGVSMRTIQEGRTFTDAAIGRRFRHGGAGSGRMHIELRAMIRSSDSYAEFLEKLNHWADRELAPSRSVRWPNATPLGRYSLPDALQLRGDGQ